MNRANRRNRADARLAWVALVALSLGAACTKSKDTEDYVPSERGARQPGAGGAFISEARACAELQAAEADARAALGCSAVRRDCPAFIRPAGGEACFEYSQASVKGCADLYDSFNSCEDFALHPCLISAASNCDGGGEGGSAGEPESAAAGQGGAGGESE
jgi:hypothetical protein